MFSASLAMTAIELQSTLSGGSPQAPRSAAAGGRASAAVAEELAPAQRASKVAELKALIKAAEADLALQLEAFDADLAAGRLDEFSYQPGVFELGSITLNRSSRASWRYSPAIKQLQKAEQQSGLATQVISEFWRISAQETF
jgi:hypothetical protein